ncbi:MAG: hypothetical protein GXO36_01125 [Chloroflexi bacterium]|nr:hypothetical protein [Chloroflexota bacterium]
MRTSVTTPRLTLFTSPKPFRDPHIRVIQQNALASWRALGPEVDVILFGDEEGVAEVARTMGFRHQPHVARNRYGTPLLLDMFAQAQQMARSPWVAFLNADIILLPDTWDVLQALDRVSHPVLVSARRWDMDIVAPIDWAREDRNAWRTRARTHSLHPTGMDAFLFRRGQIQAMPPFAIGRAGWDNWMIYHARKQGWWVIDATPDWTLIHQKHHYGHLPQARPHFKQEESLENMRLAGGPARMYTLWEATHWLVRGQLRRRPWRKMQSWRVLELLLLRPGQPHKGLRRVLLRIVRRRWQRPWLAQPGWWLAYYGRGVVDDGEGER